MFQFRVHHTIFIFTAAVLVEDHPDFSDEGDTDESAGPAAATVAEPRAWGAKGSVARAAKVLKKQTGQQLKDCFMKKWLAEEAKREEKNDLKVLLMKEQLDVLKLQKEALKKYLSAESSPGASVPGVSSGLLCFSPIIQGFQFLNNDHLM